MFISGLNNGFMNMMQTTQIIASALETVTAYNSYEKQINCFIEFCE